MKSSLLTFGLSLFLFAAIAGAHAGFDVSPRLENGQIVTGGVTHSSTVNPLTEIDYAPDSYLFYAPSWRVFGFEFGDVDPAFPNYTLDPGLNNEPGAYRNAYTLTDNTVTTGSGLPLGSVLRFQVTSDLQYWTGSGFTAAPNGEQILLQNGIYPAVTIGAATGSPILTVKTFTTDDHVHIHFSSTLGTVTGGYDSSQAAFDATAGIYMFEARLLSSDPSVAPSDPIWLVYNFLTDDTLHEQAVDWVNENLVVPEPASLVLLGLGAMMVLRRRCV